ncbi:MAG: DUF1570 domain-containing protein [Pirellulaceae bacterium]|nr:DUF1570 domain-containing protein [Pirellulaceae bacterium]
MIALRLPILLCITLLGLSLAEAAMAMDRVVLERDGRQQTVVGRLVVEAEDGGLLLLARDGVLWAVQPEEKVSHNTDDEPFTPLSADELAKNLLAELPPGFEVHKTRNYLILHNSSRAYAVWCGSLFERLYQAFSNDWKNRGFELTEPEFPLVAVIFGDRESYLRFARAGELGDAAESILGYYSLRTNRMTMCDLTGISSLARGRRIRSATQIDQILSAPDALMTVATIVHEATHLIAYNRGMHIRLSDCPLWLAEGLAIRFETPDLGSAKGWRGIGQVNPSRLERFNDYLARRPADSLATLIAKDDRFRNPATALDAYAEAWALTYFLIRNRTGDYLTYLRHVSKKKPLVGDTPEERLDEFQAVFGSLDQLDREFMRYMRRGR